MTNLLLLPLNPSMWRCPPHPAEALTPASSPRSRCPPHLTRAPASRASWPFVWVWPGCSHLALWCPCRVPSVTVTAGLVAQERGRPSLEVFSFTLMFLARGFFLFLMSFEPFSLRSYIFSNSGKFTEVYFCKYFITLTYFFLSFYVCYYVDVDFLPFSVLYVLSFPLCIFSLSHVFWESTLKVLFWKTDILAY